MNTVRAGQGGAGQGGKVRGQDQAISRNIRHRNRNRYNTNRDSRHSSPSTIAQQQPMPLTICSAETTFCIVLCAASPTATARCSKGKGCCACKDCDATRNASLQLILLPCPAEPTVPAQQRLAFSPPVPMLPNVSSGCTFTPNAVKVVSTAPATMAWHGALDAAGSGDVMREGGGQGPA